MATDRCRIDQMAHVIMEGLQEYADLATEDMKAAVKKAGNKAKREVMMKLQMLEEKRNKLLTELDTQIKVSNATTFIEVN